MDIPFEKFEYSTKNSLNLLITGIKAKKTIRLIANRQSSSSTSGYEEGCKKGPIDRNEIDYPFKLMPFIVSPYT